MQNNNRLYLDIHVLQTVPPSNLNRDETGSPKTATYGGVNRARVSSQAWKRVMREYFLAHSDESNLGVRTKQLGEFIVGKMLTKQPNLNKDDALNTVANGLKKTGFAFKGKGYELGALAFIGHKQAEGLADLFLQGVPDKESKEDEKIRLEKVNEIIKSNQALDIALFGRMVAGDVDLNEEASGQVAHAISTHEVQTDYDYFTGLDELKTDTTGSAMIGTIEFNSSTLYRYANLSIHDLSDQLGESEDLIGTIDLYIDAFLNSMPNGKVNTFANQTIPYYVLVTLRDDRPISLVGAFEDAVTSNKGFEQESLNRIESELKVVSKFAKDNVKALAVSKYETNTEGIEVKNNITELKETIKVKIEDIMNGWS